MYEVLAFYHLTLLDDPQGEVKKHKEFFKDRDITSRIYISEEGINGQMSASTEASREYQEWLHQNPAFADVEFKLHTWPEQAFPRKSVKYRKHLVARDCNVDLEQKGQHLSPKEWAKKLDSDDDFLLLDIRNQHEWELGHFEGAVAPPCKTFREFEEFADQLEHQQSKARPILMSCTGGIRCEFFSAMLREKGFESVYQLQGGVIKYGLEVGSKHWRGKLFVFDDRMAVPISKEETEVIGRCHFCKTKIDHCYNCANMDCNELFLSCDKCLQAHNGCCSATCQESPRVRAITEQNPHKPFRRKHLVTTSTL